MKPDTGTDSLHALADELRAFARARDWEQFHTPKNLSMALMVEAAELAEHFQWATAEQSAQLDQATRHEVALEIADVLIYLTRLADVLDIDPIRAAREKIQLNATRFPPV
jgi:NTP pyrophosphatase (non-canonical NTP hydrolase)